MTTVQILLCPSNMLGAMYQKGDKLAIVREALHRYIHTKPFNTALTGEDAAEEAFDLTNNPGREDERQEIYGDGRSVSSGDVIDVDGVHYLCMPMGWEVL